MAINVKDFTVFFPPWYDECAESEAQSKGYLPDVEVRLEEGLSYRLFFVDPVRLAQDLDEYVKLGKPYFAEPNFVVVPEVNPPAIHAAVAALLADGFFVHLKPLE